MDLTAWHSDKPPGYHPEKHAAFVEAVNKGVAAAGPLVLDIGEENILHSHMSRKRSFTQIAMPDRSALDALVKLLCPLVLEAHVTEDAMVLPLMDGMSLSQLMMREIHKLSPDVMLDTKGLIIFKADSPKAKEIRMTAVRRLSEPRSPVKYTDEVRKSLDAAAQECCMTIASHMRQNLDMADIKTTNVLIEKVGAKAYSMRSEGLKHVSVGEAMNLGEALEIFKPNITYQCDGDEIRVVVKVTCM
jgi:hypothetical protein